MTTRFPKGTIVAASSEHVDLSGSSSLGTPFTLHAVARRLPKAGPSAAVLALLLLAAAVVGYVATEYVIARDS